MSTLEKSDEELNAFVDDQLSGNDRARVLELLSHDTALQKRVAEIQQTRNLLRHAYKNPPQPHFSSGNALFLKRHKIALAMSLVLGILLGSLLHLLAGNTFGLFASNSPKGVVIQVSEADPAKWEMALINARNVRKAYGDKNVGVEIVAYGPGLKMLRNDSAVAAGLDEAKRNGVKLLACGNTMNSIVLSILCLQASSRSWNVKRKATRMYVPSAIPTFLFPMPAREDFDAKLVPVKIDGACAKAGLAAIHEACGPGGLKLSAISAAAARIAPNLCACRQNTLCIPA